MMSCLDAPQTKGLRGPEGQHPEKRSFILGLKAEVFAFRGWTINLRPFEFAFGADIQYGLLAAAGATHNLCFAATGAGELRPSIFCLQADLARWASHNVASRTNSSLTWVRHSQSLRLRTRHCTNARICQTQVLIPHKAFIVITAS